MADLEPKADHQTETYTPPPGPPPDWNGSYASDVAENLVPQGWTILNLPSHPHNTFGDDKTHKKFPADHAAGSYVFKISKLNFILTPSSTPVDFALEDTVNQRGLI